MLNRLRHLPAYLYIVATMAVMGLLNAVQPGSPPQSAPATPAAQCERALGDKVAAAAHFRQSLEVIERSGDLRRKRERITRAVIAVIATNAAKDCGDNARREQYEREARELLSGNLVVDGMSPKFFSPFTMRLVSATELLKELDL